MMEGTLAEKSVAGSHRLIAANTVQVRGAAVIKSEGKDASRAYSSRRAMN